MKDLAWLKEIIKANSYERNDGKKTIHKDTSIPIHWINQVEQPELPVIPEWFEDWLIDGGYERSLYGALDELYALRKAYMEDWAKLLPNGHAELQQIIARVLDNGVGNNTVEEKKYFVLSKERRVMLVRMMDDKTIIEADGFIFESLYQSEWNDYALTEKEIKDYDERYWAFAVPVEELDE